MWFHSVSSSELCFDTCKNHPRWQRHVAAAAASSTQIHSDGATQSTCCIRTRKHMPLVSWLVAQRMAARVFIARDSFFLFSYCRLRKHWPRPRSLRVQPREINFFPQTFSESAAKARKRGARCAGTSKEGLRSWGAVTATPYTSLCHVEVCLFRRPARRQDLLQSFFGAFAK